MKVIILAGGLGTRLGEMTEKIPKPMIKLDDKPIIWHIMNIFSEYGHNDFLIATGYKSHIIEEYFEDNSSNWNVRTIDTGINTMTGGRAKKISRYLDNEPCFLTYGDGLANINIDKLLNFHKKNKKIATITAVRPPARFGELYLEGDIVLSFKEKPQLQDGWINGGFFILEPEFFKYIENDETFLEREPIERITDKKELVAYRHEGFWQCMDTRRDWELLKSMLDVGIPPWKIKDE